MTDESDFERFFDRTTALACLAGAEGSLERLNPVMARFLGRAAGTLREHVHPDDWDRTTTALRSFIDADSFAGFEHRLRDAGGEFRRLRWNVLPPPRGVETAGRLLIGEEVSADANELRALRDQLRRKEKLTTLGELSGSVAHELRHPLGVISNCVYYLANAGSDMSDEALECLHDIQREVATANRIVGELLDFARPPNPDLQDLSAGELITEALGMLQVPAGITLHLQVDESDRVKADRGQVVRVLRNLMLNAIQAMPEQGRLRVGFAKAADGLQFTVSDTGPGIAEEQVATLFEPLVSSKARGIGLGLPLSRRYAELNGGSLDVDSTRGDGATFVLTLPNPFPDS